MPSKVQWADHAEAHDYPAAEQYLSLVLAPAQARKLATALRKAPLTRFKAKDILRASGLPVLGASVEHVKKDLDKIKAGQKLSPILLVRGDARAARPLIVADGYHRVCASWIVDEDADIPCQIADAPRASGSRAGPA